MKHGEYHKAVAARVNILNNTIPVTGVDTIPLPVTAAQGTGMQVQLFGQSAQNLVVNGDFRNGTAGWTRYVAFSIPTFTQYADYINIVFSSKTARSGLNSYVNTVIGNKYYCRFVFRGILNEMLWTYNPNSTSTATGSWQTVSSLVTANAETMEVGFRFIQETGLTSQSIDVKGFTIINLTATFGAGNEPTKEQCDLLFANYFEGTDNVLGTGRVRSVDKNGLNPTHLYLTTPPLRSNGLTKDEIRKGTNGYELVKKVEFGTLGANIITGGDFETGLTTPALAATGSTWVWNSATKDATLTSTVNSVPQLFISQANAGVAAGDVWIVDFYAKSSTETDIPVTTPGPSTVKSAVIEQPLSTSYQRYVYSYKFTSPDHIRVILKNMSIGGEITIDNLSIRRLNESSLAGSPILTFIGSNIHYTLATPVITPIAHAGLLNSNSNGTVYFEPAIKDIITYTDKAEISDTDYPISSIESIEKNGIAVNPATAVIAEGGLSLTHPDLEVNDEVELIYSYNKESTGRGMRLLFYNKA